MTISTFSVLENTIPIDSLYKKEAFQVSMEQITVCISGVGGVDDRGGCASIDSRREEVCVCVCVGGGAGVLELLYVA